MYNFVAFCNDFFIDDIHSIENELEYVDWSYWLIELCSRFK